MFLVGLVWPEYCCILSWLANRLKIKSTICQLETTFPFFISLTLIFIRMWRTKKLFLNPHLKVNLWFKHKNTVIYCLETRKTRRFVTPGAYRESPSVKCRKYYILCHLVKRADNFSVWNTFFINYACADLEVRQNYLWSVE